MSERLNKVLSRAGVASRRAADRLIEAGRVKVNGTIVRVLGSRVDPGKDAVVVDGRLIPAIPADHTYLMLNKPRGYVTTLSDPEGRKTIRDLLRGTRRRVYPVGRLDYNSEGLLLLTDDGELGSRLMHPRNEVPKTYAVKVRGTPDPASLARLRTGIVVEGRPTRPAEVAVLRRGDNAWVEVSGLKETALQLAGDNYPTPDAIKDTCRTYLMQQVAEIKGKSEATLTPRVYNVPDGKQIVVVRGDKTKITLFGSPMVKETITFYDMIAPIGDQFEYAARAMEKNNELFETENANYAQKASSLEAKINEIQGQYTSDVQAKSQQYDTENPPAELDDMLTLIAETYGNAMGLRPMDVAGAVAARRDPEIGDQWLREGKARQVSPTGFTDRVMGRKVFAPEA